MTTVLPPTDIKQTTEPFEPDARVIVDHSVLHVAEGDTVGFVRDAKLIDGRWRYTVETEDEFANGLSSRHLRLAPPQRDPFTGGDEQTRRYLDDARAELHRYAALLGRIEATVKKDAFGTADERLTLIGDLIGEFYAGGAQ